MIGETILHYKVTDKLGAGGMGEVYLAHDERLDRQVALKFLPAHVQSDPTARERFLREARAASKLTHPNIVALYYIEEVEGRDFIVMEYVRGRSLRDVIAEGDIPLNNALTWAREIAGALSAAHAEGIVHRDIKAENIVLTENGHAKILDFGLAKLEGATQLTETTSTVGTVAYMAPEQTRGEDVDGRADLFSLGVLLYEMVAGHQPFRGEHRAAVTYAVLNEEPEPLARYKSGVSDDLQRIVDKALRKDPATRYQTGAGMVSDIDALYAPSSSVIQAPVTPARSRPAWVRFTGIALIVFLIGTVGFLLSRQVGEETSDTQSSSSPPTVTESEKRTRIAVLPFENMGAADDEYFADGITEEITARLARIGELGVIARTSVLRYKNTELPIEQIGKELDVDYILEGTVRWQHAEGQQSRVRVTPQLIKVTDATHVWADVFDEPLTAVFEVQSDIAGKVIDEMNLTLVGAAATEVVQPTDNMEAYDAFLRGMNELFSPDDIELSHDRAAVALQRAIELDPDFAEAHAGMSIKHSSMFWYNTRSEEDRAQSFEYAIKALEIDPNSALVRAAMGFYYYHCELDYDRALEQFDAALQIQPNRAEAIAAIAYVKRRQGDFETAIEYLKRASNLDPRFHHYYYELGETLMDVGRHEEAGWYLDMATELAPENIDIRIWRVIRHLVWKGDVQSAREEVEAVLPSSEHAAAWKARLIHAWILPFERRYDEAIEWMRSATFDVRDDHFEVRARTQDIATLYWFKGDREMARVYADSALASLEAYLAGSPGDSRVYSALGQVYSLLGQKDKALESARKGVEAMPVSKEAKQGPWRVFDLTRVLIRVEEFDEALDQIEYLLSIPAGVLTVPFLRIDPEFDPLRDHPRFQALVEG